MTSPTNHNEHLLDRPLPRALVTGAIIGAFQLDRGPIGVLAGFVIGASAWWEEAAYRKDGEPGRQRARRTTTALILGVLAVATLLLFVVPALA